MAFLGGMWVLWGVFGFYTPTDYRCQNALDNTNYSDFNLTFAERAELLNYENSTKCQFYDINQTMLSTCLDHTTVSACVEKLKLNLEAVPCSKYIFDDILVNEFGIFSATMDFGLFCDKQIIPTVIASCTFVAFFIGAAAAGYVSDRFGRKRTVLIGISFGSIFGLLLRFMPTWWSFLIFWLLMHTFLHLAYISASVYVIEILGPAKRHYGQAMSIGFGIGYILSSPLAYGFPHWQDLTTAMALFSIPVVILIATTIPVSPRWLYVNGKTEEGLAGLESFAVKTKSTLPAVTDLNDMLVSSTLTGSNGTIFDIFRSSHFRKVALLMGFNFFAVTVSYYGLSYNAAALPGNLYVNNGINGIVETIAYILLMYLMPLIGRRILTGSTFFFGGAMCLICGLLFQFGTNAPMLAAAKWLSFAGKFFISGAFGSV